MAIEDTNLWRKGRDLKYSIFLFLYFLVHKLLFCLQLRINYMQPLLLKVDLPVNKSILYHPFVSEYFYDHWHFHPELELFYVEKGDGLRLVGDSIERFDRGDLVLLGSNIPHAWKCDAKYYDPEQKLTVAGTVIQLPEHFMIQSDLQFEETQHIVELLQKSRFGLCITGKTAKESVGLIKGMESLSPFHRVLTILEILNMVATSGQYRILSTPGFISAIKNSDSERINKAFNFILQNFTEVITLEEISALVNLTPTSFCRYFKLHTQKSFTRYLNEVRISYACKLLKEREFSITRIGYESGFQNLSNFNRQFKKIRGVTPRAYWKNQGAHPW